MAVAVMSMFRLPRKFKRVLRAAELATEQSKRLPCSLESSRVQNDVLMAHLDLRLILTLARQRHEAMQRKVALR